MHVHTSALGFFTLEPLYLVEMYILEIFRGIQREQSGHGLRKARVLVGAQFSRGTARGKHEAQLGHSKGQGTKALFEGSGALIGDSAGFDDKGYDLRGG